MKTNKKNLVVIVFITAIIALIVTLIYNNKSCKSSCSGSNNSAVARMGASHPMNALRSRIAQIKASARRDEGTSDPTPSPVPPDIYFTWLGKDINNIMCSNVYIQLVDDDGNDYYLYLNQSPVQNIVSKQRFKLSATPNDVKNPVPNVFSAWTSYPLTGVIINDCVVNYLFSTTTPNPKFDMYSDRTANQNLGTMGSFSVLPPKSP